MNPLISLIIATQPYVTMPDPDPTKPCTLLAIHPPVKTGIDWAKWERRAERVTKIGGAVLTLAQIYFFASGRIQINNGR